MGKMKNQLLDLPSNIHVDVRRGKSGALIASLPKYDVFTEAENLNELFFQVNDLINTYFDIPKRFQNEIFYIPSQGEQKRLLHLDSTVTTSKTADQFTLRAFYSSDALHKAFSA